MSHATDALAEIRQIALDALKQDEEQPSLNLVGTGTRLTTPTRIKIAAEYSARTGHRLRLDYKNEHGRHTVDRLVVVHKVRRSGFTGRTYIDANDLEQKSPRSFVLDRIEAVTLDG